MAGFNLPPGVSNVDIEAQIGFAPDDGGPAFPCIPPQDTAAGVAVGYPHPDAGMTLRDYFAAKAMRFVFEKRFDFANRAPGTNGHWVLADACATEAYDIADAMLKARAA